MEMVTIHGGNKSVKIMYAHSVKITLISVKIFNWNIEDHFFLQYLYIYVCIDDSSVDEWRIKCFECLGGKSHVKCQCY